MEENKTQELAINQPVEKSKEFVTMNVNDLKSVQKTNNVTNNTFNVGIFQNFPIPPNFNMNSLPPSNMNNLPNMPNLQNMPNLPNMPNLTNMD